ncbi:hypothetical protein ACVRXQ_04750 [Streptococcus panodentis]|uniref:Uncharacterized protein n=1 Tax=Streptococcus panodentis TaxID=1581472 RepID=A0ABS5AXC9_9STRE|nr:MULTISPECIES: hypothetical protein [Streptococcus]KXT84720.1 hypothetical protein STRDD11_00843 [Streptococcus sp. DD11]MBP2621239.1 hypothetical protein [Streptococcus panodentis]
MDKQYLQEKLTGLRSKYVESTNGETAAGFLDEARMNKKMLRIKKKLVSLEMERCQKRIEHRDLSKIDQKISQQKALFQECCKER